MRAAARRGLIARGKDGEDQRARVKNSCAVRGCFWQDLAVVGLGLVGGGLPMPRVVEASPRASEKKGERGWLGEGVG